MMEMTVSSTVMMAPRAMYQNHCFITDVLMRDPPVADPSEPNFQPYATLLPAWVAMTTLRS